MSDLIDRQDAIDAMYKILHDYFWANDEELDAINATLNDLPSAQPENQVHLCDSCRYIYPECPSEKGDVIFGNGKGNDNICACNKYEPSAQPDMSEYSSKLWRNAYERGKRDAQSEEDCDTCKHGYFGDDQCNNCRVRYPSHYERRTDD